jgi:hypothetical protein
MLEAAGLLSRRLHRRSMSHPLRTSQKELQLKVFLIMLRSSKGCILESTDGKHCRIRNERVAEFSRSPEGP